MDTGIRGHDVAGAGDGVWAVQRKDDGQKCSFFVPHVRVSVLWHRYDEEVRFCPSESRLSHVLEVIQKMYFGRFLYEK